jgi:hypothetical protein
LTLAEREEISRMDRKAKTEWGPPAPIQNNPGVSSGPAGLPAVM